MQESRAQHNAGTEPPLFEATLYPHRSLPPQAFWWLMAAVACVSFSAGLAFAMAGAWPVLGFFGLDVLLLFIAFRVSYRSGRLMEHVRLTRDELVIRRVQPDGRAEEWRVQPYWLRVDTIPTREEVGAPPAAVRLSSHGRSFSFARFLTDEEREDFSRHLTRAIARCRAAPESS